MVKTTNLRLNLDKPDHRKAYEILQNSDKSYSKTIVVALILFSENKESRKHLFDGIRKIVREEISAVFEKSVISAKALESENSKNDNSENISDNDYDENEDFVDDDFLNM